MSNPALLIEDHPYDRGYFDRYYGRRRPTTRQGRSGWDDCNRELRDEEREAQWAKEQVPSAHPSFKVRTW